MGHINQRVGLGLQSNDVSTVRMSLGIIDSGNIFANGKWENSLYATSFR